MVGGSVGRGARARGSGRGPGARAAAAVSGCSRRLGARRGGRICIAWVSSSVQSRWTRTFCEIRSNASLTWPRSG